MAFLREEASGAGGPPGRAAGYDEADSVCEVRLSTDSAHEVQLRPSGWAFGVAPGESILEAARRAGIRLPSSCRNGTCRACLCRMVSGAVDYRVEWPGVSRDERDEGWLLPCVARPRTTVVIDVPRAARLADEAPRAPLALTGARR